MNFDELNEIIRSRTVGTKPADRKNLMIVIGDETVVYVCVAGIRWDLVIPVGCCLVRAGSGRCVEIVPSWRDESNCSLVLKDNPKSDHVRGSVEFDRDLAVEIRGVSG